MSRENINLAVIGLGKMGLLHASILNTLQNVKLVALCEKDFLPRRFFAKVLADISIVGDIHQLSDLDIDAVYVATPIPTHYPILNMLYSENVTRNIFVEKTLASNYSEAKELCRLGDASGGVNMVGYMKRFAVPFRKAKDLLSREILGKLISFDAYAYSSDFYGVENDPRVSQSRGGVLRDLGAHIIDLALFFFGNLQVRFSHLNGEGAGFTDERSKDSVNFAVENSNGLKGRFRVSWCMGNFRMPEFGMKIRGSKGVLSVDDYKVELKVKGGDSKVWYRQDLNDNVFFLLGEPEYFREDERFVEAVLNNRNAEPSFSTASKVDYIIDQVECRSRENDN